MKGNRRVLTVSPRIRAASVRDWRVERRRADSSRTGMTKCSDVMVRRKMHPKTAAVL